VGEKWWVKDKGGRKQALCLFITKLLEGRLYAGKWQQEERQTRPWVKGLSSGCTRKKDKENLSVALGCKSFKLRARC